MSVKSVDECNTNKNGGATNEGGAAANDLAIFLTGRRLRAQFFDF